MVDQIKRRPEERNIDELRGLLEPVKSRILASRTDEPSADREESDFLSLAQSGALDEAAQVVAEAFLSGQSILLVGRETADHALAVATFFRGMQQLAQAMRRTRDVVTTQRGSLDQWSGSFSLAYHLGAYDPVVGETGSELGEQLLSTQPRIIIALDPLNGALEQMRKVLAEAPLVQCQIIAMRSVSACVAESADFCIAPSDKTSGRCGRKPLTLSALIHALALKSRDCSVNSVINHPRSQALVAQLHAAELESNESLVALSMLFDDMPMQGHARELVKSGLGRINKGWTLQPRTSHSKGTLSYGLRALLTEVETDFPYKASELQVHFGPFFSAVCYAGEASTLIDCLLSHDRKTAFDKAAKASLVKAKTYFPSLKHLGKFARDTALRSDRREASVDRVDAAGPQALIQESSTADDRLLPIIAEQRHAECGGTQMVTCMVGSDHQRCFVRSDELNVSDALVRASYAVPLVLDGAPFWADTFSGDIILKSAQVSLLKSTLQEFLAQQSPEACSGQADMPRDGKLNLNQRTSALALWIERQPWGRGFPEPVFEQEFFVRKGQVVMESHQSLMVDDVLQDRSVLSGEGFRLLWRHSVHPGHVSVRAGDRIFVAYRLKVQRNRTANDVYGEVVALEELNTGTG